MSEFIYQDGELKELDININSIKITNDPYKYMNPIKEEVKLHLKLLPDKH